LIDGEVEAMIDGEIGGEVGASDAWSHRSVGCAQPFCAALFLIVAALVMDGGGEMGDACST